MTLSPEQRARLMEWGVHSLSQVDDHPFAWWALLDGEHVVVKAGDASERHREALALEAFSAGATSVTAHDRDLGLLVTRRILPGDDIRPLARHDDDAATREIALLAAALHGEQGSGAGLPPLHDIGRAFAAPADPRLPARVVDAARALFDDLVSQPVTPVVLHGDLHHLNVLRLDALSLDALSLDALIIDSGDSGHAWRAIDPHGWVGDPAFEAAALLANPRGLVEGGDARGMDGRDLAARSRRRSAIYAEVTGYDAERLRAWGMVGCVIAELWMIESHDLVHGAPLAVAQALLDQGL